MEMPDIIAAKAALNGFIVDLDPESFAMQLKELVELPVKVILLTTRA
jgi:hypothetical protein